MASHAVPASGVFQVGLRFIARGTHATQGLPTIRAYGAQSRFRDDFLAQMDLNGSWWFAFIATARWVGFRLDNIAAAVLMLASIFVMALHSKVPHLTHSGEQSVV